MAWSKIATGVMALSLVAGTASVALSLTPAEEECCFGVMDAETQKYYLKHIKKARKCTLKMEDSTKNPTTLENCFAGMAASTGQIDWLLQKFQEKSVKKARKKCTKKLNITCAVVGSVARPGRRRIALTAIPTMPRSASPPMSGP